MKRKLSIALALVAGIAVVTLAADSSGGKSQKDQDAAPELRAQIAELRSKIQTLEGRTQSLESQVQQLKQSHTPTPLILQTPAPSGPISPPNNARPPTVWGQREVNGWTYYIVPCEQKSP